MQKQTKKPKADKKVSPNIAGALFAASSIEALAVGVVRLSDVIEKFCDAARDSLRAKVELDQEIASLLRAARPHIVRNLEQTGGSDEFPAPTRGLIDVSTDDPIPAKTTADVTLDPVQSAFAPTYLFVDSMSKTFAVVDVRVGDRTIMLDSGRRHIPLTGKLNAGEKIVVVVENMGDEPAKFIGAVGGVPISDDPDAWAKQSRPTQETLKLD